jgi:hypothetical protein
MLRSLVVWKYSPVAVLTGSPQSQDGSESPGTPPPEEADTAAELERVLTVNILVDELGVSVIEVSTPFQYFCSDPPEYLTVIE